MYKYVQKYMYKMMGSFLMARLMVLLMVPLMVLDIRRLDIRRVSNSITGRVTRLVSPRPTKQLKLESKEKD